jgi:hypothetical protein
LPGDRGATVTRGHDAGDREHALVRVEPDDTAGRSDEASGHPSADSRAARDIQHGGSWRWRGQRDHGLRPGTEDRGHEKPLVGFRGRHDGSSPDASSFDYPAV